MTDRYYRIICHQQWSILTTEYEQSNQEDFGAHDIGGGDNFCQSIEDLIEWIEELYEQEYFSEDMRDLLIQNARDEDYRWEEELEEEEELEDDEEVSDEVQ
jgi:hypothetical protein